MKYNEDEIRPRLSGNKRIAFENLNKKERRILVIGDLHAPFVLPGYLEHCQEVYANYNCNQVIYIGDILDNHAFSYHEPDPNGLSAGNELIKAKKFIKDWYKAFPVADVLIGNHDRMAARKAMTGGVPSAWIKSYNDVLGTPKWNWCETIVYDNVLFEHGEGGQAARKAQNNMMSSVCGHTHTSAYVQWFVGKKFKVFGMQIGCGVDSTSYAAAYARNFKKQAIGCGVVIGGHTAINCMMNL
jgi:predicted phosphodiesterase